MTDFDHEFGTKEERDAALRVAIACKELNMAIFHADFVGVNVKVVDAQDEWDRHSNLRIHRMERRVMILPTPPSDDDDGEGALKP
jgi:hypothetical protein